MTRIDDLIFHGLRIGWKLVYSGQTRTYYRGECSGCGWIAKGYRVTEERAEEDHRAHVAQAQKEAES